MRGVLRARQGRGNHKDKVIKPGKDGAGGGDRRVEYGRQGAEGAVGNKR